MPFDEQEQKERVEYEKTRRLQGAMYGKAYCAMVHAVMTEPEGIELEQWTRWVSVFMHREETAESFNRAIAFCRQNQQYTLPVGRTMEVKVPMLPGKSQYFIEAWLTYASVDAKVMFIEKLKDLIGYYAFLLEVAEIEQKPERRKVTPLEELGMA